MFLCLAYKQIKGLFFNDKDKNMLVALIENYNSVLTGFLNEEFLIQFYYLIIGMFSHLPKHGNHLTVVDNAMSKIENNEELFINIKQDDGNSHLIYPKNERLTL